MLMMSLIEDGRSSKTDISFFVLGAATTITWDSIYMSVSYFQQFLGKQVLSVLSLCFSLPLFLAMLGCLCLKRQLPVHLMALLVRLCIAYMLGFSLLILLAGFCDIDMPVYLLCSLVGLCGISSGLMQSMVASVSGLFSQFSLQCGASGAALKGTGGAILVPMAVQISFLPAALAGLATVNMSLMLVFVLSTAILSCSLAALRTLSRSSTWALASEHIGAASGCLEECRNPVDNTLGRAPSFSRERLLLVKWCAVGQVFSLTLTTFLLALSPHVPPCESTESAIFWERYLATVLVATHTVANFLGRITVSGQWCRRPAPVGVLVFVVLIRLLFIPCILGYTHGHLHWLLPEDPRNLSIIVAYGLMSFTGGLAAMLLSQKAQSLCGHDHRIPCPIVSQITWIAIQLGGLIGVAFSCIKVI
ncbi:unnamed protein product [Durusdinium trenchii]|uniref:Uncharacterized protein n=2 Tax=Durusdinium trenchii TaxID=1381693 RepID=A0ABP0KRG3_9DINO